MKQTKWKQLFALALSASMLFSSVQAPAFATEANAPIVQQAEEMNQNTEEIPPQTSESQAALDTEEAPPQTSESQAALHTEDAQPQADEHTASAEHQHSEQEPFVGNVKWVESGDVKWAPKMQPFAAGTKAAIDPSDLTDWSVYSHYGTQNLYDQIIQARIDAEQGDYEAYNVFYRPEKPGNWDTTVNANGKHPWYPTVASVNILGWTEQYLNLNDPADIAVWEEGPGKDWGMVSVVSDHIFSKGITNDASITFVGYGTGDFTDWALAPISDDDHGLKAISFDIDAAKTNSHTIRSYGALINAGVSGGKLKGYAVLLSMSNDSVYLVDMSSGIDVDKLHDQNLPADMNGDYEQWEQMQAYFVGGGLNSYMLSSPENWENRMNPINLDGSPATLLGTYDRYSTIHVYVEFDKTNVRVEVGSYASPGVPAAPTAVYNGVMNDTGHSAFGPYADYNGYVGDGHTCSQLSWVRFLDMNATIDLKVTFRDIDLQTGEYETKGAVDQIEKGKSIGMMANETGNYVQYQLPMVPTKPGKAFVEWNTSADGTGERFDINTPVNELMTVYAIWADNGINVSYHPDHQWTNQDVDINVEILTAYDPISVAIDYGNGTLEPVDIQQDPMNPTSWMGHINTEKNLTSAKIVAMVSDGQGGEEMITLPVEVTWIDKAAPTVANLPGNNLTTGLLEASDIKNDVQFEDLGTPDGSLNGETKSGINETTKVVHFFNEAGTTIVKSISWDQLEQEMAALQGGVYGYAVSVLDKAGNYGDSNGKTSNIDTKPDKPTVGPVSVNATKPEIDGAMKTKTDNQVYPGQVWTNQDVIVNYDVNSNVKLDFVKENSLNQTVNGNTYNSTKTVTTEGKTTILVEAGNVAGNADPKGFEIWIDKTKPKAELPASNVMFDANDVKLNDIPGAGTTDASGLDNLKTEFVAIPYVDGKPDANAAIIIADLTQISTKLKEGTVYDLTLKGADNATNPSNTATAKGVLYVPDKTNPPVVNTDSFEIYKMKTDLGSTETSVNISSTTGALIKDIHVKIKGVDQGSKMRPTTVSQAKTEAQIYFYDKGINASDIVFAIYLHTGQIVDIPYVLSTPQGGGSSVGLATTNTSIAGGGQITHQMLLDALNNEIEWNDGAKISNYTLYYKNGVRLMATTSAQLKALCRVVEREVYIVSKDASGTSYYLAGSGETGEGIPDGTKVGIKVKG